MRTICLLLCLLLPLSARGQAAEPRPAPPFRAAAGAFFALSVADVAASARWYQEKLGLRPVMQVPKQGRVAVTVLEGGGLIVELLQHDDARPPAPATPSAGRELVHGLFKVGLVVEDFDATVSALRARGVEIVVGPFPAREGQRANVVIRDNGGNLIQFFGK